MSGWNQEQEYQAGVRAERERREAWLNRVRTWYPEKTNIWMEGYETAETRIIDLLKELDIKVFGRLVYNDSREELIALIKGANK